MAVVQRAHDGFGDCDRDVTDIDQGQILQKEIHGGLEMLVNGGEGDNEEVPRQGCHVNQEEENCPESL